MPVERAFPDFAALNPGYKSWRGDKFAASYRKNRSDYFAAKPWRVAKRLSGMRIACSTLPLRHI